MESLAVQNLSFTYPNQARKALDGVSFTVNKGEFLALAGPSGCGKSTLLRHLKPALAPHGEMDGMIFFDGKPLREVRFREQSAQIGFVMQSPENQIVTDRVWHELAFGLESLGMSTAAIRARVAEMSSFFGIEAWFHKSVSELSGGQKQILSLASIMVMQPSLLILDEPSSQLDPIAAADFLATIGRINRELGTTVIITEHRLEEVLPMSDRVIVMDEGRIICDAAPREAGELLRERGHAIFHAMPAPMRIFAAVPSGLSCPITVREGRFWLDEYAKTHSLHVLPGDAAPKYGNEAIELREVWFKYEKDAPDVVRGLTLSAQKGELLALVGGNGAGKTTALSLMSGLNKPYRGRVFVDGQDIAQRSELLGSVIGVLPQNPQTLFVKKTVREDLLEILQQKQLKAGEKQQKLASVTQLCRLENLLERHPYDLSGGEQQRAALAKVLLLEPRVLLLDEPTKGLDAEFKQVFAGILRALLEKGVSIVMVSHDVEFCAKYADRCAMLFDGAVVAEGAPREFFAGNSFYTTSANRMARYILPNAVTAEDVIFACGGEVPPEPELPNEVLHPFQQERTSHERPDKTPKAQAAGRPKLAKRTIAAAAMILLALPLTMYFGIHYLDDRKYYLVSLLVMLEAMLPFFMIFEGRKPQARELVVISVLCAIGVAGRSAFFMLPHFKPVAAVTIISGVAFGGEAGFMVGAVTMLLSNFMFGQGPLTPWQMFAMGLIGFIAGVLLRKGLLRRSRLALCAFGAVSTVVIYGGIMNPSFVILSGAEITRGALLSAYIAGLPMDLVHASATVFFLWVASKPMLEKLDRIKIKYGLVENRPDKRE